MGPFKDIGVELADGVATIEIRRPPHNFFDIELIRQIADACEALDKYEACRAIVLAAQGTAFCAGAKLGDGADVQNVLVKKSETGQAGHLYIEAVRLFRTAKPIVGAIHGAAVGGGLGLALVPDLRVTCPEARFSANFTPARLPPGLRPHPHAPRPDRALEGGADVLHKPPHCRRRGLPHRPRRRAGAAGRGARRRAEARQGDRRVLAAGRARHARDDPPALPTGCAPPPTRSWPSRRGCARPPTSRKASSP